MPIEQWYYTIKERNITIKERNITTKERNITCPEIPYLSVRLCILGSVHAVHWVGAPPKHPSQFPEHRSQPPSGPLYMPPPHGLTHAPARSANPSAQALHTLLASHAVQEGSQGIHSLPRLNMATGQFTKHWAWGNYGYCFVITNGTELLQTALPISGK